ncbi:MAG: hypothetical protein Fur005_20910 [Roseiflexaceae bacterium]
MSHDPSTPEVAQILEQLRAAIRAQRIATGNDTLSPTERDLRRSLDELELYRVVSAHWPLKARTPLERPLILINKVVRRLLRWYINPIVEQQNAYNDAVARSLRILADAYNELAEQSRQATQAPPADPPAPTPAQGIAASTASAQADQATLQAIVVQRGATEPPARFPELDLVALAPQLSQRASVSAHWPIGGSGLIGQISALMQKSVRQYLRWLINPIVDQQNAYNDAVTGSIRQLSNRDGELRAEIAALRARRARP